MKNKIFLTLIVITVLIASTFIVSAWGKKKTKCPVCTKAFGSDYEECGAGPGMKCCFKGKCCKSGWLTTKGKQKCCEKNEKCTTYYQFAACNPTSCPSYKPKLCTDKDLNFCCPEGAACLKVRGAAECGKATCDPETEQECNPLPGQPQFQGGSQCCKRATQTCLRDPNHGYPFCQPKNDNCGDNTKCFGKGDHTWRKRCCDKSLEVCTWNPGGYPICRNKANIADSSFSSSSNSIYVIRENNQFSLDGIAYTITPDIEFNVDVSLDFNYSPYLINEITEEEINTYKYSNHEAVLAKCTSSGMLQLPKTIGTAGGTLDLNGEVILTIPPNALTQDTELAITKYELTSCIQPGSDIEHELQMTTLFMTANPNTGDALEYLAISNEESTEQSVSDIIENWIKNT